MELTAEFCFDGQTASHPCTLTDLGTGGLSFLSRASLHSGDRLSVKFKIRGKTLTLASEVIRTAGKNTGVQYKSITEEDLALIQEFIHSSFFEKDRRSEKKKS